MAIKVFGSDEPVKIVRKKSEKSGGHSEHLKIGVRCETPLLPRKASTKKRTQSLSSTGDEAQAVRALYAMVGESKRSRV
jgi:type VI protein secretion system component VasA